jgi:cobaltochelatase CobS
VPDVDPDYRFDRPTTLAILAVLPTIAASSSRAITAWASRPTSSRCRAPQLPCVRQPDSHISRIDLIGKDAIVIRDGMQVTEFRDGILPGLSAQRRFCFDEYDAGRPT